MGDTLSQLEEAGFPTSRIPDEQKQVLSSLTDEEVRVLTSIKQRMDASSADVEGHMRSDDGYVFW
jgi:hypothetical protein